VQWEAKMFEFKEKPTERKIIVIIDYYTKRKLKLDPGDLKIEMNDPVMMVENGELSERDNYPFVVNLKNHGLIKPGEILIQDCYDEDNYFPATEAKYLTAEKKVMLYQNFFFLLGAKSFDYLELKEISDNSETQIKGGIKGFFKGLFGNANTEYKTKIDDLLKSKFKINSEVREQKCNINKAKDFMYKYRLYNEELLKNILSNFEDGIVFNKTSVEIRLFQEVNRIISILGNINLDALGSFLKIDANFYKEIKSKSDFEAKIEVNWV